MLLLYRTSLASRKVRAAHKRMRIYAWKCSAYLSILVLFFTVNTIVQAQDALRVGLLVPNSGPFETLGMQVKVGVELGLQDLSARDDTELVFPSSQRIPSWDDPDEIRRAYSEFRKLGVDFIIGGMTTQESDTLLSLSTEIAIPVALLSPSSLSFPSHYFQIGVTQEEIYRETVQEWAQQLNIDDIMVIYDKTHNDAYRIGTEVTADLFQEHELIQSPFTPRTGPVYSRQVQQALRYAPDGIIIAAHPWEAANIARQVGAELETPIYIAGPSGWSHQVWEYATAENAQLYYGKQYWPSTNSESIDFADRLRNELGWSRAEISDQATQAYDAVMFLNMWIDTDSNTNRVIGFTGDVELVDGQVLRSPVRLLHVNEPTYPTPCPSC